jgi:hypothetical protein
LAGPSLVAVAHLRHICDLPGRLFLCVRFEALRSLNSLGLNYCISRLHRGLSVFSTFATFDPGTYPPRAYIAWHGFQSCQFLKQTVNAPA